MTDMRLKESSVKNVVNGLKNIKNNKKNSNMSFNSALSVFEALW